MALSLFAGTKRRKPRRLVGVSRLLYITNLWLKDTLLRGNCQHILRALPTELSDLRAREEFAHPVFVLDKNLRDKFDGLRDLVGDDFLQARLLQFVFSVKKRVLAQIVQKKDAGVMRK